MLNKTNELRLITASLYYLSQEAKNAELQEVSSIITNAINIIEHWSNNENIALTDVLCDSSTMVLLSMYSRLSKIPLEDRMELLKILEEVDKELTEEEKSDFGFNEDVRVIN
jgi:hypothetical protein